MSEWNTNLDDAPFMTVLEVSNELMKESILATRGYVSMNMVNENTHLFTGSFGELVCPTKWRKSNDKIPTISNSSLA